MPTRKFFFSLSIILMLAVGFAKAQTSPDSAWTEVNDVNFAGRTGERQIVPRSYRTFKLNKAVMSGILDNSPEEFSQSSRFVQNVVNLPMPDGTYQRFRIEHSLIVEPGLLVNFPELGRTYNGRGIDDPTATVRLDLMPAGFHAMVLSSRGTIYIDPYAKGDTNNYLTYFQSDNPRQNGFYCDFDAENPDVFGILDKGNISDGPFVDSVISGSQLRTYRLALAATNEYCNFYGGLAPAMAGMVTTMNRVNGVYERDLAIRMVIVANNNLIVYASDSTNCGGAACTTSNDPYSNSNGSTMLGQNQSNLDTVIGSANYDIGHVLSTGGGGIASVNVPCTGSKARGVTGSSSPTGDGFDIDYVAHEMGHQFGALHTFNGTTLNCGGGNRSASAAYEPGSGITIMAYAGICGADDLAAHSIDTFHVKSLEQIIAFREGTGVCGPATATGNTPPTVSVVGGPSFNIPKSTPFMLSATANDANGDSITYDWQEYDLPQAAAPPNNDADGLARPLFRPYLPLTTGSRTYPSMQFILNNANVPPATTSGFLTGEILPSISRTMNFQVIARDNRASGGGINTATATVVVNGASGPFVVTAPNTAVTIPGGSTFNVTWNVAGTTAAPVNAANVKISFSTDGGTTFPTTILASTPNDGTENVTIPNLATTQGRIKIEAVGNIFFDVSDADFTVTAAGPGLRAPFDYDGDDKTDLSIFRPSNGQWWTFRSGTATVYAGAFGSSTDVIVPADFTGDNKTDWAFWRPSTGEWFVLRSDNDTFYSFPFGSAGDIPVTGDFDNDGKADATIFRPATGTWFLQLSGGGISIINFGSPGDKPVVADYDGDGKSDIAIWRASLGQWWMRRSSDSSVLAVTFGGTTDKPVQGYWTADNKADLAFWRASTGTWYVLRSEDFSFYSVPFGTSTDIPAPGDYDGDDRFDTAVFRPSTGDWFVNRTTAGILIQQFGSNGDRPTPNAYVP